MRDTPKFYVSQVVRWISSINSISPMNKDFIPPIAPNSLKCQALCGVRSPLIFTKLVGGISSISTSSAHNLHLKKPPCSIYLHTLDKIFKQGTITSPWEKENHQKCLEKRIYCSPPTNQTDQRLEQKMPIFMWMILRSWVHLLKKTCKKRLKLTMCEAEMDIFEAACTRLLLLTEDILHHLGCKKNM